MSVRIRLIALTVAVAAAVLLVVTPVRAEPEGGTKELRDALTLAAKGYSEAKTKVEAAKKRQGELSAQVVAGQARVAELTATVGRLAAAQYKGGSARELGILLNSGSTDVFLQSAAMMRYMSQREGAQVMALKTAEAELDRQRKELDVAILEQEAQLKVLFKRRDDALKALRVAGGGDPTLGFGDLPANAQPAPRGPGGSWLGESCSVGDPTTDGCLTPRTLHAFTQVKIAGFGRYVSCYRSGEDGGEHPRGRACDFAAASGGFENAAASGGNRDYGNRLAAWLIANSDRLAVLYVIWYRQIWMAGTGWRSYSGSGGPAAEHTNHVHLSIL